MHIKSILTVATVLCGLSAAFDLEARSPKGKKGSGSKGGSKGGSEEESSTVEETSSATESATESPTETATALGAEQTCSDGWDCQNAASNVRWCCGPSIGCGSVDYSCDVGEYKEDGQCRAKDTPDRPEYRWSCPNDWNCNTEMESSRECIMNDSRRRNVGSAVSSASASLSSAVSALSTAAAGTAAANTQGSSTRSAATSTSTSDANRLVGSMAAVLGLALAGLAWL